MTASRATASRITTHVLDTSTGLPAEGIAVELFVRDGADWRSVATSVTDADGRIMQLGAETIAPGEYRLRFDTRAYFAARDLDAFFPEVLLTFALADDGRHCHVPLLLGPFAYSSYRGS
ncbi:hydroxyisourate hydrolase [Agromyces badenianii]|uniref:5-hydroxyisourate hydrolase n=1 Tax=Agromyces badenianii TaxID=2080742 RepID=A0A2S0WXM1_9MICO|nr:hydroxyisourate hydrolase [Agromyces badenianii]AWB96052.1 hydroxyisourate hydrolase [Agromyces badenianii]PWC04914.1 hydroxyisourate hydrolase [Agromyces badenianii]